MQDVTTIIYKNTKWQKNQFTTQAKCKGYELYRKK
jgi:hypothetical protein